MRQELLVYSALQRKQATLLMLVRARRKLAAGLLCVALRPAHQDRQVSQWTLVEPPIQVLGRLSQDTSQQFGVVTGGFVTADGTIAVGDATTGSIRFFRSPGRITRVVGRNGSGPGEFRELSWVGDCGPKAFAAFDGPALRLTRFDSTGQVALVRKAPTPFVVLRPLSCRTDGGIIAFFDSPGALPKESGLFRTPGLLISIDQDFLRSDTIGVFPGTERYVSREVGGYGDLPLGLTTLAAAGPHIAVVARNDSSWITIYQLMSRDSSRVNVPLPPHRVTSAEFAAALVARVADEPTARVRQLLTRVYASAPVPSGVRYLRRLVVDELDRVWIETFERSSTNTAAWLVLDMSGKVLSRINLPADSRVLHADNLNLLLRIAPQDGPETVALYRVRRQ